MRTMFGEQGVEPGKVIEADTESVISNLVSSGLGLSLVREDLALARERAGEMCIWPKARVRTTLWFIYRAERASDPLIAVLLDVLAETWHSAAPPAPQKRLAT